MPGQLSPASGSFSEEALADAVANAAPLVDLDERLELIEEKVRPGYKRISSVLDGWAGGAAKIQLPSHQDGDLLVACLYRNDSGSPVLPGWTPLVSWNQVRNHLFFREVDGEVKITETFTSDDYASIIISSYRGSGLSVEAVSSGALTDLDETVKDIFYFGGAYFATVVSPAVGTAPVQYGSPSTANVMLARLTADYSDGTTPGKSLPNAVTQLAYKIVKG